MNHRPVRDQLRRAFQISGASERGLIRRALVSPHCRQSRCTGTQVFLWLPWSDSRNSHAIDPAACGCLLPVSSRTPVTDYLQQSLQRGLSRETTSDQSESRQRQLQTRFLPLRARSAGGTVSLHQVLDGQAESSHLSKDFLDHSLLFSLRISFLGSKELTRLLEQFVKPSVRQRTSCLSA